MTSWHEKLAQPLLQLSFDIAAQAKDAENETPIISMIIPCYNGETFLKPCLESLSHQTLRQSAFEVICIDDCSTDNTVALLDSYRGKIKNLRIIRHEHNKKQGAARNTGLDMARGLYVTFMDSDDFIRMDALETLLHAARNGADVVVSQLLKVRYDKPYRSNVAARRLERSTEVATLENKLGWFPVSMLIRRDLLEHNSIRFQEGVYFEDIEFCIRTFLSCKECVVIPDQLYYYIQRDGSTVNLMTEKKLSDSALAMASVFQRIAHRPDLVAIFRKTAISWLRLQAARTRDGMGQADERAALGKHLVAELSRLGVFTHIGNDQEKELLAITAGTPKPPAAQPTPEDITSASPWGGRLEAEFRDKVIFFCEVDYHIRSVAPVARILKNLGVNCIIVDASRSTSFSTNRPLPEAELPLYADLDIRPFNVAEILPFSTDAAAFIFMNDLTYTNRLIFENFGFGVPTFGFYEGINDDWNLDRISPRMPYRSVDYLLLPGIYQQGFYRDRECRIVGLPNVRSWLAKPYAPPTRRRAIINVNFTYGVLEDRRDSYVESAVRACQEMGLDYIITQHPADKADLSAYNVGKESVYDMLAEGSLLISRFSTTMLEALAMGRPVIYHNPINERVPKFGQPLGAYSMSHDVESLKAALQRELDFVDNGGSVRDRSALFLHFHCNTADSRDPSELAAAAIAEVVSNPPDRFAFKTGAQDFVRPRALRLSSASVPESSLPHANGSLLDRLVADPDYTARHAQLLQACAAALLLDPVVTLEQLGDGTPLAKTMAEATAALGEDNTLVAHYRKTLAHAQGAHPRSGPRTIPSAAIPAA
jgi:hypothetical protein